MNNEAEQQTAQTNATPENDCQPFDLESVHDSEISPLMKQIIEVCKRVNMPMLATFCYRKGKSADDPDGVEYCTTSIPRGNWRPPEIEESILLIRHGASSRPKLMGISIRR
jgi:hypothetical protein